MRDAFAVGGDCGCGPLGFRLGLEGFDIADRPNFISGPKIAREKMRVARLLGAGLARKNFDEGRLALYQVLKAGLHGAEVIERMHALGAGAKLAGSLRTAQQQNAKNSDFVAIEVEGFLKAVFVLGDAAVRG